MQNVLLVYLKRKSNLWGSISAPGVLKSVCLGTLLLFWLSSTALSARHAPPADSLAYLMGEIGRTINSSATKDAAWSVSVRDGTGRLLVDVDGQRQQRIASNSKLFVSAALLLELGPDFRYTTTIYGDGRLDEEGIWQGDLHIIGAGDPSINGHFYNDDPFYVFDVFLEQLRESGIQAVHGDIFGNEALFDEQPYPRGWEWDDLSYYYAPELSALSFNRNCVDLSVNANGKVGDTPEISWFPYDTDYVNFVNEQSITPAFMAYDESYQRILGTNTIMLRSTLPIGYLEEESLSVSQPTGFFLDSFQKHAEQQGMPIRGGLFTDRVLRERQDFELLARHVSEPLHKLLWRLNRNSDNFYAEMLTKTLSAVTFGPPGTTETGLEYVEQILQDKLRFDTRQLRLRDASGMASANVASANALSSLLQRMYRSPYNNIWMPGLALAGYNGTLENRFITSPALGRMYAKTGFSTGVRSLSGYLTASSGVVYSFSILTNNYTQSTAVVDGVHENIIALLYEAL